MDLIDGSGFWMHGTGAAVTPPTPTVAGADYIPTWRPRRRAWMPWFMWELLEKALHWSVT